MARQLFDIDRGGRLTALQKSLADSTVLMERIGLGLLSRAQRAFREQKRGNNAWGKRMTPNIGGVVSDLNAGRQPQKRRFVPGPALRDTGQLLRSLTIGGPQNLFRATPSSVEVGTNVPYAQTHQTGGVSFVRLQKPGRAILAKWLKRNRQHGPDLGWLFSRSTFTIRVKKRPFLGFDAEDLRDVQEELSAYLDEMMDG